MTAAEQLLAAFGECDWGGCTEPGVALYDDTDAGRIPVCLEHAARCAPDKLDRRPPVSVAAANPDADLVIVEPVAPTADAAEVEPPAATTEPADAEPGTSTEAAGCTSSALEVHLDPAAPVGALVADVERGKQHPSAAVRRAATKAEAALVVLLEQLRQADEVTERQRAEAEARQAAQADVDRLEQQLREALDRLHATAAASRRQRAPGDVSTTEQVTGPRPCIGCAGPVRRPKGTHGSWPQRCATCKAAA